MIGERIAHYKILEKLPSAELRTGPSIRLRAGGEGGSMCGLSGLNEMWLFNSVRSVMFIAKCPNKTKGTP